MSSDCRRGRIRERVLYVGSVIDKAMQSKLHVSFSKQSSIYIYYI